MNPLSEEIWSQGLPYLSYRERVTRNAEAFDELYRSPTFTQHDLELLRRLPPQRVLAVGEDWCPDVYHTLPTWARIVEELPGWELRVFPRDVHPELMKHFLWKDEAQRIPVYAFYDRAGRLQAWWSGRSATAQEGLEDALAGRSFGDLDAEEKKRLGQWLEEGYRRDFRRANLDEILALLRAFFHLS